jgi:glyoxylase-like metal-dependent hydrolase (beta-lactamase superfamily II)
MSWSVVPLDLGNLRDRPKETITYRRGEGETVDLVCYAWLLVGDDGPLLVDTGPSSGEHAGGFHRVRLEKSGDQALERALAAQDVDAADIGTVILTHLHWDHCYGLPQVPNARVLVADREIRYGVYPDPNDDRRKYEFSRGAPFLKELRRMEAVVGEAEVAPGVRIIPTPGHSPGHQSVLVEAETTTYLLAGDFLDLYENWTDRCPSGGSTIDVEAWQRSYDTVEELDVAVLPSHDPLVLRQAVYR